MPSISSYFNPCSKEFNAAKEFKKLTCLEKSVVSVVTVLVGLLSASLLATPVFRLLVGRFKKLDPKELPATPAKVDTVAKDALKTPGKDAAVDGTDEPAPVDQSDDTADADDTTISLTLTEVPEDPRIVALREKFAKEKLSSKELYEISLGYDVPKAKIVPPSKLKMLLQKILLPLIKAQDKVLGSAIDNGDCFYHSYAEALNIVRKQRNEAPVTAVELRQKVAEYAAKNKGILEAFEKTDDQLFPNGIEHYADHVGESVGIQADKPVWGIARLDGAILCELYNVNLTTWFVGLTGANKDNNATAEQFYAKGQQKFRKQFLENKGKDKWICKVMDEDSVKVNDKSPTIEIVRIGDHIHPIFNSKYIASLAVATAK